MEERLELNGTHAKQNVLNPGYRELEAKSAFERDRDVLANLGKKQVLKVIICPKTL